MGKQGVPTVRVRILELMRDKTIRDGRDPDIDPITQSEIAKAIEVPQGTISRWAGQKVDRLDKNVMARLCQYFECGVDDLLELSYETPER